MAKRYLLPGGLQGWAACTSSPPAVPGHVPGIPRCHQQPVRGVVLPLLCRAATTQQVPPLPKGHVEPAHPLELTGVSLVVFFLSKQPLQ